jgi:hypothetical protein
MRTIIILTSLLVLALPVSANITSPAHKSTPMEITPFIGYRFGGDFQTYPTRNQPSKNVQLTENTSYGVLVAWPYAVGQQGELLISQYDTDFSIKSNGISDSELDNTSISVTYAHIGGNVPVSEAAWVSGGLGLSHLSPNADALNSETRFSMNIGLNTKVDITKRMSFRVGGRVYGTFFNTDSAAFCGASACKLYISSKVWVQTELDAGLTFKF